MRDEAEKPTKSGDDFSVGSMIRHEETVTESSVVKRKQRQSQKVPNPQSLLKQNQMIQMIMVKKKNLW